MSEEIPLAVRTKLEACGLRLSTAEWRSIPAAAQERLAELSVDQRVAKRAYADFVRWLRDTFLSPRSA